MDHIPSPQNAKHLSVLFVELPNGKFGWDHKDWQTFEKRCSDSLSPLERSTHPKLEHEAAASAFLQSWLFFGVIAEFFSIKLDMKEWTTKDAHLIAVSLLHCTLASAWNHAFHKTKPIFRWRLTDFDHVELLNRQTINCGWCRTDLKLLRQHANLLTEYDVSRLGPV